jgi:hypothetical protein
MKPRIVVSLALGLLAALFVSLYPCPYDPDIPTDYYWSHWAGRRLLAGLDCYEIPPSPRYVPYPLTAPVLTLPLALLPLSVAVALFAGASSALLAFALTRPEPGQAPPYWRLLMFCSFPYSVALVSVQWSPLLVATMLLPALLPLNLAKPQYLIPNLPNLNRRSLVACILIGIATLLISPTWPWRWLRDLGPYDGFVPAIVLPPLLISLLWWREERARLLGLLSVMPQQWMGYDQLAVWLLPRSAREMIWYTAGSWLLIALFAATGTRGPRGLLSTVCFYLPALLLVVHQSLGKASKGAEAVVLPRGH